MDRERLRKRIEGTSARGLSSFYQKYNKRLEGKFPTSTGLTEDDFKYGLNLVLEQWEIRRGEGTPNFFPPEIGVLRVMGYKAGQEGLKTEVRRMILTDVINKHLPLVGSPEHMEEWGEPKSEKRINKVKRNLRTFKNQKIHKDHDVAKEDWASDLKWIEDNLEEILSEEG